MKFISWNVNGLRACMSKGFAEFFCNADADIFSIQETKLQEGQIDFNPPGYTAYWNYAEKTGYSGTAVFVRHTPLSIRYGMDEFLEDNEGRIITLEMQDFFYITVYTPNSQRGLTRLDYRLKWENAFLQYLKALGEVKPVIVCGDLNVAHKEIDLKNPNSNRNNAGFTNQERDAFSRLLSSGFTDSFRALYPDQTGAYTWWSYMYNARTNNAGWRIDYYLVSDSLVANITDAVIFSDVTGSDHCPIGLVLSK